ncbi:MAG TPA: dTDP-4-amino-4,6-dideoxygalactose transaminase [Deltaproteobacteria bacterium]|nr:dTDP-4-amino-4,6-dideoxygalactose transaminase [Deltaproteobacteria bacterium]
MLKDPGSASPTSAQSGIRIPLNKPFIAGNELSYIREAVERGQLAADGHFARRCHELLEASTGAARVLLTPSCTAALEMAAMLCDLGPADEVILPSYTFVSTASAIVREGATPIFVDIREDTLNLDETLIEAAITPRTRAIFPVHYAGVASEMDTICRIARENDLLVVEDAAQAVGSRYKGRGLGSIGDLAAFSFHETKNFICGEGGALCINDSRFVARAEIIRDKGTDRQRFFRGETDRYTWQELGSSYVASEICAAFLFAQLEEMESITERRAEIAAYYSEHLSGLEREGRLRLPCVPPDCETNAHLYHLLLPDEATRDGLMSHLRTHGILAVFHYVPLHDSPMGTKLAGGRPARLPVTESVSRRLLRLPFYCQLEPLEQEEVVGRIRDFFER